jgi:hypothetical protein
MNDQDNKKSVNSMIPVVVIVVILVAAIGWYLTQNPGGNNTATTPNTSGGNFTVVPLKTTENSSTYKDGEYMVTGNYVSPGGPREIDVILTLTGGVISAASVEVKAEDATSIRFQEEFVANYKPMVIGKSISDLSLTKVSGSSLTPKGFNDAIEKIKMEAQS